MSQKTDKPMKSLSQILNVSVTAILAVLLLGNLISNTLITQAHLQERMFVHARDAATSLGLSVSSLAGDDSHVIASRMIDSIYDSGDFSSIRFVSTSGETLHEIKQDSSEYGVPRWFVSVLGLDVPPARANVMSGWTQIGNIEVLSRLDKAYDELWQAWVSQVAWFVLVLVIAVILVRMLLNRILKPLLDVEKQASEMSRKNFSYRIEVPESRELASVADAMNFMAESLGGIFDRQLEQIESLRVTARVDALTGLFNREGFDQRMSAELESEHGFSQGALCILNIHQLEELNREHGRAQMDIVLRDLGYEIADFLKFYPDGFGARRTGGDFALFLPGVVLKALDEVADTLFTRLMSLRSLKQLLQDNVLHMGLVSVFDGDSLKDALSKADFALREAEAKQASAWQRYGDIAELSVEAGVREANQWHRMLEQAIVDGGFELYSQSVLNGPGSQALYDQILARLHFEDKDYSAGVFIPMAKRFGMMSQVDRQVIEKVLKMLPGHDGEFGVSLSEESMQDAEFMYWFYSVLQSFRASVAGESVHTLRVHFPEYALVNQSKQVKDLSAKLASLGVKVVIERFGVSSVPFSYLQWLELDAIKIDHSFVRGIDSNSENQFFLRSAIQMAHSRQVKVIAVGVENEAEKRWLESAGIDGMMGYFFDRPKKLGA